MVNQNQIEHARLLVKTSGSLSDAERAEWLSLLPFMSDKQLLELCSVLEPQKQNTAAVPAVPAKSVQVKKSRRALPEPPAELDLPAPAAASLPPRTVAEEKQPAIPSVAQQMQQNSVSVFLDRNFGAALHRASVADIVPPAAVRVPVVPPPVAPAAPVPVAMPATSTPSIPPEKPEAALSEPSLPQAVVSALNSSPLQAASEEVVSRIKNLDDARRLTVATLRAKGTEFIEEGLKELSAKYGYFSVQLALEYSPLYQTYVAIGGRVLQDHVNFEALQAELSAAGRPYLAKTEFEEMSDVLQRVKGE